MKRFPVHIIYEHLIHIKDLLVWDVASEDGHEGSARFTRSRWGIGNNISLTMCAFSIVIIKVDKEF
jgi:hypothetical protein